VHESNDLCIFIRSDLFRFRWI